MSEKRTQRVNFMMSKDERLMVEVPAADDATAVWLADRCREGRRRSEVPRTVGWPLDVKAKWRMAAELPPPVVETTNAVPQEYPSGLVRHGEAMNYSVYYGENSSYVGEPFTYTWRRNRRPRDFYEHPRHIAFPWSRDRWEQEKARHEAADRAALIAADDERRHGLPSTSRAPRWSVARAASEEARELRSR